MAHTADNRPAGPAAAKQAAIAALVLAGLAMAAAGGIQRVVLQAGPRPIDWDSIKGPDGVPAKVLLYAAGSARPTDAKGKVEVLLFEGNIPAERLATARPMHLWPFPAKALASYRAPLKEGPG